MTVGMVLGLFASITAGVVVLNMTLLAGLPLHASLIITGAVAFGSGIITQRLVR